MRGAIQGLRQSMDMLKHNVEKDVEELSGSILETDKLRQMARDDAHAILTGVRADLQEVRDYVTDLTKSNSVGNASGNSSGSSWTGDSGGSIPPRSSELTSK